MFPAVLLNFMFMMIINANFRSDNGTLSDRSPVKLIDISLSAYTVISTVTSWAVRNSTGRTVMSVSQISKRRLVSIKIKLVPFVIARTL
jgi:hypothetical protein